MIKNRDFYMIHGKGDDTNIFTHFIVFLALGVILSCFLFPLSPKTSFLFIPAFKINSSMSEKTNYEQVVYVTYPLNPPVEKTVKLNNDSVYDADLQIAFVLGTTIATLAITLLYMILFYIKKQNRTL